MSDGLVFLLLLAGNVFQSLTHSESVSTYAIVELSYREKERVRKEVRERMIMMMI